MSKYHVGQTVWVYHSYSSEPRRGEVVKVGRTLVHVQEIGYRGIEKYRMDTGVTNSGYMSPRIKTEQERAEDTKRVELIERLRAAGYHTIGNPPLDQLERVVLAAEAAS